MVSMARIELALHAPKARVMPFHYALKPVYLDKLGKSPRYSDLSVEARSERIVIILEMQHNHKCKFLKPYLNALNYLGCNRNHCS